LAGWLIWTSLKTVFPLYSFGDGRGEARTVPRGSPFEPLARKTEESPMKGILLWLVGIPIPIIILLYLFGVF
jgi:hypothetical protein